MYHKVNDLPGNRMSMPVSHFDEQMTQLRELGYVVVDLDIDEAAREIAVSKLRLEDKLGRPVRAFSYVKGSEAHYKQVHLSLVRQAGYDVAFTAVSGANTPSSDPLQLRRYNVEPYSARTFELVLAGACDLISVKDTVTGTRARRVFNAALGTSSK